jgi:hypothetical protein
LRVGRSAGRCDSLPHLPRADAQERILTFGRCREAPTVSDEDQDGRGP